MYIMYRPDEMCASRVDELRKRLKIDFEEKVTRPG